MTVPVCYRHPSRETYVRCTRCDRPICPDCMREASVGHQCPECVAEGRRTQRPARTAFGGGAAGQQGYVTKTLIGAQRARAWSASIVSARRRRRGCSAAAWGGLLGGGTPLTDWGAVLGYAVYGQPADGCTAIADGEYYRLITAMFLHYGVLHLLLNMWALWMLGRNLEAALGPLRFARALPARRARRQRRRPTCFSRRRATTAGASTAIFGLFAAIFIVLRRLGRDTSAIIPILVINLVFTFTVPGISMAGHLGGLVVGGLVAVDPGVRAARPTATLVQAVGCAAGAGRAADRLLTPATARPR